MFKCWISHKVIPAVSIHAVDAQIAAKNAKATAINTAYAKLADQPIQHFQPSQWTALIDHAVVSANEIRFVFRTGTEITAPIS